MLLPTTYLGPISWYRNFLSGENVIDIHEHYIKQTIRNRCSICGPNGKMELIIPVNAPNHTAIKDVTIEYSDDWQRKHWGAIKSAYGQSPYFEFYSDKLEPFYRDRSKKYLIDLNHSLIEVVMRILNEKKELNLSTEFIPYDHIFRSADSGNYQLPENDRRLVTGDLPISRYIQVFSDRFDFMPDLSIIDLLFCKGPEAKSYLHSK